MDRVKNCSLWPERNGCGRVGFILPQTEMRNVREREAA
jgi:hypothetical protein